MKFRPAIPLLITSVLLLTGCTGDAQSEAQPAPSVEPETSSPAPSPSPTGPVRNVRGNIPKKIGEMAVAGGKTIETSTLKFRVTSIEPITCDAPYAKQPAGTALAVALEVETTPDFKGALSVNGVPGLTSFSSYYWKGYTSNGTRMNQLDTVASQNCVADTTRLLPSSLGKGEKAAGIVVLEVTTPTGSISYDGGWEWEYPAK
jgi:hypothetical protein